MIKEFIEDLRNRKQHKDMFKSAYRTDKRGNTLSEVFSDAEALAIRLGKVKPRKNHPENTEE